MAPTRTIALILSTLRLAAAHFYLNHPPTIGFDDDLESSAPCGSFPVDFSKDKVTDFHVGGDSVALTSIHPMATWLFRATLDQGAVPTNWTSLLPAVQQTGLGDYCERGIVVPESFAGKKGVIGVVQNGPDGILYQCSTVNFVSGTADPPSDCKNVTGLAAKYTTDDKLSMLPTTAAATSGEAGMTATATAAPAASTSGSGAQAMSLQGGHVVPLVLGGLSLEVLLQVLL